jgi:hypothetical protein
MLMEIMTTVILREASLVIPIEPTVPRLLEVRERRMRKRRNRTLEWLPIKHPARKFGHLEKPT